MMASQLIPIVLSLIAAVFGAIANWLYRRAALQLSEVSIWKNFSFMAGLFFFVLVLVLLMTAFRLGGRMMVVYPVYSTTYVWALLLALFVDHEKIVWPQYIGISLIVAGVSLIGWGAKT